MIRELLKKALWFCGIEVRRKKAPASPERPVGSMPLLLEDLRARGLKCGAILDVGGFHGDWSRMAKRIFPEADCFIIEPQIEKKSRLDAFCQEYPGSRWFNAGAGAESGELVLTIFEQDCSSSFVPRIPKDEMLPRREQRTVPVITIDSLIDQRKMPVPELIKMDIQGFEIEALRGGELLFGKTEVFIMESSLFQFMGREPILHELLNFMAERGYVAYDFPGFLRRPLDGALAQIDVCFVKEAGIFRSDGRWQA